MEDHMKKHMQLLNMPSEREKKPEEIKVQLGQNRIAMTTSYLNSLKSSKAAPK
jgi:hypothetical protein